jgi:hypothetical protein
MAVEESALGTMIAENGEWEIGDVDAEYPP